MNSGCCYWAGSPCPITHFVSPVDPVGRACERDAHNRLGPGPDTSVPDGRFAAADHARRAVRPAGLASGSNVCLGCVRIGQWYRIQTGNGLSLDGTATTRPEGRAGLAPPGGEPPWVKCQTDSSGNPLVAGSDADWLFTTMTATAPVTVTLELSRHEPFGGFAYRPPPCGAGVQVSDALVWLNGQQVPLHNRLDGYTRVPVAKRFGWHDAVLVDLPLLPGVNRLAVSLDKNGQQSWYNAVGFSPNPVPVLWAMIENDFVRSRHRLLEQVHYDWFDPVQGWFGQRQSWRLEMQWLEAAIDQLGADGQGIQRRLDQLIGSAAGSSDTSWLASCVTTAELRAMLRDTDALAAAVTQLAAAYDEAYPAKRLLDDVAEFSAAWCGRRRLAWIPLGRNALRSPRGAGSCSTRPW